MILWNSGGAMWDRLGVEKWVAIMVVEQGVQGKTGCEDGILSG